MCGRHLGARNLLRVHRLRERVRDGPAGLDVAHDVNGRAVRRRAGVRLDGGRVLPGAGGGGSRTDGGGHRIAGVRCGGDGLGRGGGRLSEWFDRHALSRIAEFAAESSWTKLGL